MGFVWAKYAGLWLNGWDTWPVWSDTHSPLFKVRGQHTIVSSEMRYIDFANMRVVLWKNSPIRSLYPPLDDVILVERIAQISESAPLVFDLLPHAMICINYLLIKMAQSFDSALDIKHIIEKYRKASKLKYAKVFQRSVLPSLSDTAHASELVRWQFGGVSLGLSPLAEYSEVLKCTKVEQSKDVSLDLSPLSDIRPHQLSLLQASRHFHLIHQIPVQNHKRSDGNDSGYWCSLFP